MLTGKDSDGALAFLAGLARSEAGSEAVVKVAGHPATAALIKAAGLKAADPDTRAELRVLAVELLAGVRAEGSGALFLALLGDREPPRIQGTAAAALARSGDPEPCRAVYQKWPEYSAAVRREVVAAATGSPTAAVALLDAVEGGTVRPVEIPQSVRDALSRLPRKDVADRAAKLLAATAQVNRQAVIDQYQSALTLPGDPKRGGSLFKEHCAVCHAVQGVGQKIGPDLASVGSRPGNILLVDVLDPSRQVQADYLGYILATKDGKVISGLVTAETAGNVTIRREGGAEETIARSEIEDFQPTGKSMMPEGLEQKLTPQQIADVLEFLRRPEPELLR
jgi:putative heme-binding domain-containing protein